MTEQQVVARRGRPRIPDEQVITAARAALEADPSASMQAIADHAGVGKAALYLRFPSRVHMLQHFAEEATAVYAEAVADARRALDAGDEARAALEAFATLVVTSDVHTLQMATAGTFPMSEADIAASRRAARAGNRLVRRLREGGAVREDVTWLDLMKAFEALTAVHGRDPDRTRALRLRLMHVMLAGFGPAGEPLRGPAPGPPDFFETTGGMKS